METVEFSAYKFFSANFVPIVVKDNRNELEYAKSAESDGLNLRKMTKTSFLGQKHSFFKNPKRHFSRLIEG